MGDGPKSLRRTILRHLVASKPVDIGIRKLVRVLAAAASAGPPFAAEAADATAAGAADARDRRSAAGAAGLWAALG